MADGIVGRLEPLLLRLLGPEPPVRVRAWDGSETGPPGAPAFVIRDRRALRRLLWKPGEVGLVRAFVAGELDIEGDVYAALGALQRVLRRGDEPIALSADDKREIVRTAVMLGAVGPEPKAPPEEAGDGLMAETPAALYAMMTGDGHGTGVGRWAEAESLKAAQEADARDMLARLAPKPGESVLELNAGFAAFSRLLAAECPGVSVTAVSPFLAEAPPGVTLETDLPGGAFDDRRFDAVVSTAGTTQIHRLAERLVGVLRPGGRLLARQTVHRPDALPRPFTSDYVYGKEGDTPTLGEFLTLLDAVGLEVRGLTALREDYARTLRGWARELASPDTGAGGPFGEGIAGEGVARVWSLHLATTALACENGRIGVYEVEAVLR
ncbi:class I SAM-dependent methyltransferase [Actinocorallia sp. A-T 12471]|uniref:class I SAM-dependent methyltransferase n=1 Tax=Actinocorallia sp. A-T 12471 TaxID=3089813 RepID=UPI0029D3CD25|nr:class I SAM-dependent methyltransferase [Actinocorallia sp. A-T 12471]MDX6738538.1 class I SAM-dependent methyltransferase [Actinocorallia sp. A-T 12471]